MSDKQQLQTDGLPGDLSVIGMTLSEDLTFEEWSELGQQLQNMERSIMWWIGDWLRFGERKFGEEAAQAVQEKTGYGEDTVRVAVWVSERIDPVTRVTDLTWSHHREVAGLEPKEQVELLKIAKTEGLSTRDLKKRVVQLKISGSAEAPPERKPCLEASMVFNEESVHIVIALEDDSTQEFDIKVDSCKIAVAGTMTFYRCAWCNGPFLEGDKSGRFCSDSCRWTMSNKSRE